MATGSTSRMLLREAFTGSNNLESNVTHFVLLAELQKWKKTEEYPASVDERPHCFDFIVTKEVLNEMNVGRTDPEFVQKVSKTFKKCGDEK